MFKRNTTFKCTQCGAKFTTPDFEYMATVYTMPPKMSKLRKYPHKANQFVVWKADGNNHLSGNLELSFRVIILS